MEKNMLTLKKPKHLSAAPVSIRHSHPGVGFYEESLTLTAEMENGNINFSISVILPENDGKNADICYGYPTAPRGGHIYLVLDEAGVTKEIASQLEGIKRLSKAAEKAILEWAWRRAKEYANSRIM